MIYDYVNTKPPLEELYDELEHGWLKDTANKIKNKISKIHKYISKHRTKDGKWVYVYSKKKSAMKGDSRYKRSKTNLRDNGYARAEGERTGTYTKETWIKRGKKPFNTRYKKNVKYGLYKNRATLNGKGLRKKSWAYKKSRELGKQNTKRIHDEAVAARKRRHLD